MHMIIRFQNGLRVEALVLAAGREQMRVIIPQDADTLALSRQNGCWQTDGGEGVEIEALTAVSGIDCAAFCSTAIPRTMSARTNGAFAL